MMKMKLTIIMLTALAAISTGSSSAQARGQGGAAATPQRPAATPAPAPSQTQPPQGVEESWALETPTGKLFGTLLVPKSRGPYPVVLIIAGSGPTDRNGNTPAIPGANNSYKYLAEALAARGIASLRYDKRGVGESHAALSKEEDVRFDTYIEDAALWGQKLRADRRFSKLVVAGHSEGSLIGMVAAQRLGADAYISIAGAGTPIQQTIAAQLKGRLTPELQTKFEAIMKSLSEGKTEADVPPQLAAIFRPSVQPYLISWFKYDPTKEIAKLKVPVLIAQGTHDLQISVEDARLLAQARPSARLLLVEGMSHTLKDAPAEAAGQTAAYTDPSLPVVAALVEGVSDFIKALK
jgi:hypothetical protein